MTIEQQSTRLEARIDPMDCSMAFIERSIFVAVPPEEVPICFDDPTRYPLLFPHVARVHADSRYPALGSKLNLVYRAAGITFEIEYTVIEDRPGSRTSRSQTYSSQFQMNRPFEGLSIWNWEPVAGGTRLTAIYNYEIPQTAWGRELEKWVLRRYNAENLERSLKNIKRVLEASYSMAS